MVPEDGTTLFLRGRSREAQNDFTGAVEAYRLAAAKDPSSRERKVALAGALTSLGEARYDAGEFTQAWDLLQEARRADPTADLSYVEGTVAYALAKTAPEGDRGRHLDVAAAAFTGYRRRPRTMRTPQFNLGAVLLAAERYQEAIRIYLDLLASDPKDGDLYMVLSRAHSSAVNPGLPPPRRRSATPARRGTGCGPPGLGRACRRAVCRKRHRVRLLPAGGPGGDLYLFTARRRLGGGLVLLESRADLCVPRRGEVGTPLTLPHR